MDLRLETFFLKNHISVTLARWEWAKLLGLRFITQPRELLCYLVEPANSRGVCSLPTLSCSLVANTASYNAEPLTLPGLLPFDLSKGRGGGAPCSLQRRIKTSVVLVSSSRVSLYNICLGLSRLPARFRRGIPTIPTGSSKTEECCEYQGGCWPEPNWKFRKTYQRYGSHSLYPILSQNWTLCPFGLGKMVVGAECVVGSYRNNSKGSQILELKNFIGFLAHQSISKNILRMTASPRLKGKNGKYVFLDCYCILFLYFILLFYLFYFN